MGRGVHISKFEFNNGLAPDPDILRFGSWDAGCWLVFIQKAGYECHSEESR